MCNAANNFLCDAAQTAGEEWSALRSDPDGSKEKALRQWVWAIPIECDKVDTTPIDQQEIAKRQHSTAQGIRPTNIVRLGIGIDVGHHRLHYVATGETNLPQYPIVDYGIRDVSSHNLGVKLGILKALREFKEIIEQGWDGIVPDEVWIDSGDEADTIYAFCMEAGERYRPVKGWGAGRWKSVAYNKPHKTGSEVRTIGEGYHIARMHKPAVSIGHVDVDYWKTTLHQQLTCGIGEPGAITLFQAPFVQHLRLAQHFTAEKKVEIFEPGKGLQVRWEHNGRQNHFLDAATYSLACLRHTGSSVLPLPPEEQVVTDWFKKQKGASNGS